MKIMKYYRRGAVLGLTMAEVMLLLIFCMVLIFSLINASLEETQISEIPHEWEELEDIELLKSNVSFMILENSKLQDELDELSRIRQDWELLIDNVGSQAEIITALKEEGGELRSQLKGKESEFNKLHENWQQLEKSMESQVESIAVLKQENGTLQEKIRVFEENVDKKDGEIARLEAENESLLEKLTGFEKKLEAKNDEIATMNKEMESINVKLSNEVENVEASDKKFATLEVEYNEMLAELDKLKRNSKLKDLDASAILDENRSLKSKVRRLETELKIQRRDVKDLNEVVEVLREDTKILNEQLAVGEHDWPPIINLSDETDKHLFEVGKAKVSENFKFELENKIARQVSNRAKEYDATVIEVIGHTDEQRISSNSTNLDAKLVEVIRGSVEPTELKFADNAGLGMARALTVAKILMDNKLLEGLTVLPLSGGQMIIPYDTLTNGQPGDIKERRRIEIRVRRPHRLDEEISK